MFKLALLAIITLVGIAGSLGFTPFIGVAIYYLYAVLRPQYLWEWDLPIDVPWSFYVAVAAMFGTFIWKVGEWVKTSQRQKIPTPAHVVAHWLFFLFAFWIVVTYYTAQDKKVAYDTYVEYMKIFIMYIISTIVVTSIKQIWTIYLIVTCSLCYIALEMNQIYHLQGYLKVYRTGFGGLDNNGAALMLAMGVPLCLFAWDGSRHWTRWIYMLMIPVIFEAVLTSFSRGAMVAILASTPLYFLRCTRKKQLTVMMIGLAFIVTILAGAEIRERFFSVEKFDQDDSANSRLTSWNIAWTMANERPFFGFGIRNSNQHTFAYGADMEGRTIHSQYLQIAADSGLMALGLYLIAILGFVLAIGSARRDAKHREVQDAEAQMTITIANGLESAMFIFCVGGAFLSMEIFELPYIVLMMGAQMWAIIKANKYAAAIDPMMEIYAQLARQLPPMIVRNPASSSPGIPANPMSN